MGTNTVLTEAQLAAMGSYLVQLCGTYQSLGHRSALGTVQDYTTRPDDDSSAGFVWDMFAACLFDQDQDAVDRLVDFTDDYGLLDIIAHNVAHSAL